MGWERRGRSKRRRRKKRKDLTEKKVVSCAQVLSRALRSEQDTIAASQKQKTRANKG